MPKATKKPAQKVDPSTLGIDIDKLIIDVLSQDLQHAARRELRSKLESQIEMAAKSYVDKLTKSGELQKRLQPVLNRELDQLMKSDDNWMTSNVEDTLSEAVHEYLSKRVQITLSPKVTSRKRK